MFFKWLSITPNGIITPNTTVHAHGHKVSSIPVRAMIHGLISTILKCSSCIKAIVFRIWEQALNACASAFSDGGALCIAVDGKRACDKHNVICISLFMLYSY